MGEARQRSDSAPMMRYWSADYIRYAKLFIEMLVNESRRFGA